MLLTETTAKLPTILMYVWFAVLFPPLSSKQACSNSFPKMILQVRKQSLIVLGARGVGL